LFAINHAATALLIRRHYPQVPLGWLLLAVQWVELLWVLFNYLGWERTVTDAAVHSVANIHLIHMPYSHSIATSVLFALLAWLLLARLLQRPALATAVAIGVLSHIVLDLVTHSHDIALAPGISSPRLGLGLYDVPLLGFAVESLYGLFCWWYCGGGRALLAVILGFNLANITFFSAALSGPEVWLAGKPLLIVSAIAAQLGVTLYLVGRFRPALSGAVVR
jgi:hypothetical protein